MESVPDLKGSHSEGILLSTIADRNLTEEVLEQGTGADIEEGVQQLQHVRLDREGIAAISGEILPLLPNITNLYLQQNLLESLRPLEVASNLRFLTVAGNRLTSLQGVEKLTKLLFLDVSDNLLQDLNPRSDLPTSLSFLDMRNNPCCSDPTLRPRVAEALPNLRTLNGQNLDEESELEDDGPSMPDGGAHRTWASISEDALDSPDAGLAAESRDIVKRSRERVEQDSEDTNEAISELRQLHINDTARLRDIQLKSNLANEGKD